ncbi:MAG: Flp pilus assembly complex ATPase component TadA [Actinomycetota bacterium]|nr:Flp pilus assembly complex ATPase component TadA [Actinomycetota bacterium]
MMQDLLEKVFERDGLAELDPAARRLALRELVAQVAEPHDAPGLLAALVDEVDGSGILSALLADPGVTDVLVNGPDEIWVERSGILQRTDLRFPDRDSLLALVTRLTSLAGARADTSQPICDARLPDGSRLHVVMPPIAPDGPLVSVRTFPPLALGLEELTELGMMSAAEAGIFERWVVDRESIVISGTTGAGKTTLLNALLGVVPAGERMVLVEETPELRPRAHAVSLIARRANVEGIGEVDLAALVRAALRMRPDRIIVGEVRGAESLVALGALASGHEGSLISVHARSADDCLDRLVTLALDAGSRASEHSLRDRVARSFRHAIHLVRGPKGHRRVAEIRTFS